jgi:hypothetical protein
MVVFDVIPSPYLPATLRDSVCRFRLEENMREVFESISQLRILFGMKREDEYDWSRERMLLILMALVAWRHNIEYLEGRLNVI